jgi:hypothetical protein
MGCFASVICLHVRWSISRGPCLLNMSAAFSQLQASMMKEINMLESDYVDSIEPTTGFSDRLGGEKEPRNSSSRFSLAKLSADATSPTVRLIRRRVCASQQAFLRIRRHMPGLKEFIIC